MKISHFPRSPGAPAPHPSIYLSIAILVFLLAVTSGTAAAPISESRVTGAETLAELVAGIAARCSDLKYVTEQDSEVFLFYRNSPVQELSDRALLSLLRQPPESKVKLEPWTAFFKNRTLNDPSGRWRNLQIYLEANLTNLKVFRLRRDEPYSAQYDLYAVGMFNGDTVVGVQMFGVAT